MVRAILDYVGNDKKEAVSAEDWLQEEADGENLEPYTFQWICGQLDLDFKSIQKRIFTMPKRGENRVAPWYFMKEEHQSRMAARKTQAYKASGKHAQSASYTERLVAGPAI